MPEPEPPDRVYEISPGAFIELVEDEPPDQPELPDQPATPPHVWWDGSGRHSAFIYQDADDDPSDYWCVGTNGDTGLLSELPAGAVELVPAQPEAENRRLASRAVNALLGEALRQVTAQRDEAEAALGELYDSSEGLSIIVNDSLMIPKDAPYGSVERFQAAWENARQVRDRARERGESTRD